MPDQLVKKNADLNDTVELIRSRINSDYRTPFIQKLVQSYYSPDPLTFYRNVFNYVARNVQYKLDPEGKERVYKPTTTVSNGIGDCKKMTVIIGAALKAYGVEPFLKHVYYNGENYTHIYPIVPTSAGKYITLDVVNNKQFDAEVNYSRSDVYNLAGKRMDLFTGAAAQNSNRQFANFKDSVSVITGDITADLASISGCTQQTTGLIADEFEKALLIEPTETMGKRKKKTPEQRKENRKKALEKFKNVAKKGLGAGVRGAFLIVIGANVRNIAKSLSRAWAKDPKNVENMWVKFGGNPVQLKQSMLDGSKKAPLLGTSGINVMTGTGAVAITTVLATSLPIFAAALKLIKDAKVAPEAETKQLEELEADAEEDVSTETVKPEQVSKTTSDGADTVPPPPAPPSPPRAGSFGIHSFNHWSDYVGAFIKVPLFTAPLANAFPQYAVHIGITSAVLLVAYIVKQKITRTWQVL